ncbi:hypothetical protein [Vulgatibacter sp.]|uniref:hypothetical protein n=1 Tax=Vulgatibacter sp. TaxID=1971226 RepID=UPI00356721BE
MSRLLLPVAPQAECDGPAWTRTLERLEQGRVRFNGVAARACLAGMDGCGRPARCGDVVAGAVEVGGACGIPGDCVEGATCTIGESCPGTCVALPAPGEACVEGRCGEGAFCWDETCVAFVPRGGSCTPSEHRAGTPGSIPGEPGTAPAHCGPADRCVGGSCVANQRQRLPTVAEGARCSETRCDGDDCATETIAACADPLYCHPDAGTCTRPGGEGDACPAGTSYFFAEFACEEGLRCVGESCTVPQQLGEPCEGGTLVCALGLDCFDGTCGTFRSVGEACDPAVTGQCLASAYDPVELFSYPIQAFCDEATSTCVESALRGAPCSGLSDCNGFCEGGICRALACAP